MQARLLWQHNPPRAGTDRQCTMASPAQTSRGSHGAGGSEDVGVRCEEATQLLATYANYPLLWLLKFVELARSLGADDPDLPGAMAAVRVMALPSQQLLRADVQEALEAASSAVPDRRLLALHELVRVAKYAGYL